jgi:hypothetical protein
MLDDVRKVVGASIGQLGQPPHLIEGVVDEMCLKVLVQHDNARFDLIQLRREDPQLASFPLWPGPVSDPAATALFAQQDAQQRAVHLQVAVVIDEAQLPEFIQHTHAWARRADDFGQRLLADRGGDGLGTALLADIRQQKKCARQPLFA